MAIGVLGYGKEEQETMMHLEDYLEFHGPDDIRRKGHRIGLDLIIDRYRCTSPCLAGATFAGSQGQSGFTGTAYP